MSFKIYSFYFVLMFSHHKCQSNYKCPISCDLCNIVQSDVKHHKPNQTKPVTSDLYEEQIV